MLRYGANYSPKKFQKFVSSPSKSKIPLIDLLTPSSTTSSMSKTPSTAPQSGSEGRKVQHLEKNEDDDESDDSWSFSTHQAAAKNEAAGNIC